MSCCCCLTSCFGSSCGFCSECVGAAGCNTTLCSSCITGSCCGPTCFYAGANSAPEIPSAGTDAPICLSAPCLGTPEFISCGPADCQSSLTATETAAYCSTNNTWVNAPCSPFTCGSTDQAPASHSGGNSGGGGGSAAGGGAPKGGGSGSGSAKSAAGQKRNAGTCALSKLSQSMNRFGSSLSSLMAGGQKVPAGNIAPGQALPGPLSTMTPNAFLLIVLVFGGLLLMLAFGHASERA